MPVYVRNNGEGADAEALKRFEEPSWNNPVVRFLDARGKDVVERRDGVWTAAALAPRMTAALEASGRTVPAWMELAELDTRAKELARVVLSMHCFWEGQAKLGGLRGVAEARPAFLDGAEVVDVRYDPARTTLVELLSFAKDADLARRAWIADDKELLRAREVLGERALRLAREPEFAPASDDLRELKRSKFGKLVLPRAQAVRVNAKLAAKGALEPGTLSPRQATEVEKQEGAKR